MTTVNYGTGFTNEAAAWVAYANASTGPTRSLWAWIPTGINWQTAGYWATLRASAPLGTDDGKNFLRISRTAPLGFKYWEIGNEEYGSWETDSNSLPHDPYTYALRARDYIRLMKAVDPTIKIGVVVTPGEDSYANYTNHPALNARTGQTHYRLDAGFAGDAEKPGRHAGFCHPSSLSPESGRRDATRGCCCPPAAGPPTPRTCGR